MTDRDNTPVGEFDRGRGYVKDAMGSVVAEVNKEGIITGNGGQTAGIAEGFSYEAMMTLSAYILLVDEAFVRGF